jgi:hypothetical protein
MWHRIPPDNPLRVDSLLPLTEIQMELRKNGRSLGALTQEPPSVALQCGEKIINCAIDVSAILSPVALNVLRLRTLDGDMHTVPGAMATLWTSGTTLMSIQVLAFLIGRHGSSPFV